MERVQEQTPEEEGEFLSVEKLLIHHFRHLEKMSLNPDSSTQLFLCHSDERLQLSSGNPDELHLSCEELQRRNRHQ